jgi:hypothetical protein
MIWRAQPLACFGATALAIFSVAVFALWLPQSLLEAGTPLIDMDPAADPTATVAAAIDIRISLTEQYFSWAIYSMTICGVIVWRYSLRELDQYLRLLLLAAVLCSSLGLVFGSGYLELVAAATAGGVNVLTGSNHIDAYPAIQFIATTCGFLFAASAAMASILKRSAPDEPQ